jgi:hypothetical protein
LCRAAEWRLYRASRGRRRACLLVVLLLSPLQVAAQMEDTRQVFSGDAMPWLRAVGRLQVPGQRHRDGHTSHYLEDCSATLVASPGRAEADTLLTAWHCLESYGDLSRPIVFTARTASGDRLEREARPLADGGSLHADWAILRLQRPVPARELPYLHPHPESLEPGRPVTMAGYSRDEALGQRGQVLTFDPDCAITDRRPGRADTDCMAFKGASGGAVVQVTGSGKPFLCGVISQGDGAGHSTYAPIQDFRGVLNRYLR